MSSPPSPRPRRRPTALRRGRARRPALMLLVCGVGMLLVAITASAQAGVITVSCQQTALESVVGDDAALVRS